MHPRVWLDRYYDNKNEDQLKWARPRVWSDCYDNDLTTLEGAPKSVSGNFYCDFNPFDVIRKRFPNDKEFFNANNYWDFFAGDNKIRKMRFKEALLDYDKELPKSITGYEYI